MKSYLTGSIVAEILVGIARFPLYFFLGRGAEQLPCALVVRAQRREIARVQVREEAVLRAEFVQCECAGCAREPGVSRFLEWSPPSPSRRR